MIAILSVVFVAVNVGVPAKIDLTVKLATPLAFVKTEAGEIVSFVARLEASVTVLPETAFELASLRVTVMVEVVEPSAVTELGLAATVETVGLTAPGAMLKVKLVAVLNPLDVAESV